MKLRVYLLIASGVSTGIILLTFLYVINICC